VSAGDGAEGGPTPTPLVAVTANVYDRHGRSLSWRARCGCRRGGQQRGGLLSRPQRFDNWSR